MVTRGPKLAGWWALGALCVAAGGGCLGPLVDDGAEPVSAVLPPDAEVPFLGDDAALAAQVDAHDGVGRLVARVSGFAEGERVFYWGFGVVASQAIPLLQLAREDDGGELAPIPDHLAIIDSIPGDPGYSPFWESFLVPVTDAWQGERITSFAALEDARRDGLVSGEVRTGRYGNCPVVHEEVRLEVGGGVEPLAPKPVYYKGRIAAYFFFRGGAVGELGDVPVEDVYVLRREGGEPLSEGARGVDMTGDGDTNDSNNILAVGLGNPGYTPLWRVVEVVVPAASGSIDTFRDETMAEFTDAAQLFDSSGAPVPGAVVAVHGTEVLLNCPIQSAEGAK